ncbi:hypothetical protein EU527_00430 [Candidatus Thorarchaeota archaeon]|nr:MAG: hypothetical protein EU527_00430 [Candidatus Thorarchaeota archaeon]
MLIDRGISPLFSILILVM